MNKIVLLLLTLSLVACSTTDNEPPQVTDTAAKVPIIEVVPVGQENNDVEAATVHVAIALTAGAMQKDNFKCQQTCQDELKKSIENRTKGK
ncbi:hypothetical protein C2869_04095 [Saccharobesus litoralis]|uniref:Lipoprotein n=1 Tax=Saccharobesus litoralis TaxID=2172099 RepID=A0A2S0VN72_9ALTE|nr:hypothetical protein [Saccharobesus litoralis]AWB65667.1 hypothetical protein C2869_04095 [Saccharobesus litoralis]